jgi:hypothetical protein
LHLHPSGHLTFPVGQPRISQNERRKAQTTQTQELLRAIHGCEYLTTSSHSSIIREDGKTFDTECLKGLIKKDENKPRQAGAL